MSKSAWEKIEIRDVTMILFPPYPNMKYVPESLGLSQGGAIHVFKLH